MTKGQAHHKTLIVRETAHDSYDLRILTPGEEGSTKEDRAAQSLANVIDEIRALPTYGEVRFQHLIRGKWLPSGTPDAVRQALARAETHLEPSKPCSVCNDTGVADGGGPCPACQG